jgi:hypothetical protein
MLAGLFLTLVILIAQRGSARRMFSSCRLLLWMWLAGACIGPLAFDIVRHTTTTDFSRYALAGLPAAMLLAALGLSQLPRKGHLALLSAILLAWIPASWGLLASVPRPLLGQYRRIDVHLNDWAQADDVILVHSIPSGVIGVARYLRRDVRLASWIVPLDVRRVPEDLEPLLAGCRRVALVKAHYLHSANPPEKWLQAHARLLRREVFFASPPFRAEVLYFGPATGDTFFPEASEVACGGRAILHQLPLETADRETLGHPTP